MPCPWERFKLGGHAVDTAQRLACQWLSLASLARIQASVADSEREYTGQIRVGVETHLPVSYLWRFAMQGTCLSQLTRQRAQMQHAFKRSEFEVGLALSVTAVTDLLKPHFPKTAQSQIHLNELSDAPQLI